tara:strand:- start:20533 stop:21231 length:699 start_codon:yes stop_codon:yes gene_type:complete
MKFKLHTIAIAAVVGLAACGDDAPKTQTAAITDDVKPHTVPVKTEQPEVVEEVKKPELDWVEPTETYYTIGLSPLDPSPLINRYEIDEKARAKTAWITTDKTTLGYLGAADANGTLYRHENLYDEPETASDEQLKAIDGLLSIEKAMPKNCKKLTERMSFKLAEGDYDQQLVVLKTVDGQEIQTWFFQHKADKYYLISQRDIAKPKGYTYRCKSAFEESVVTPAMTGITYHF